MADGLGRVLSQQTFDPEKFVKNVSNEGEDRLQGTKKDVEKLQEETALALKKNVYKNYSQFIETAKEISILENEMYQLSHMLTDQKSIIHNMLELSLTGSVEKAEVPSDSVPEEDRQKNLAFLLEKVEGCSSVMEVRSRYLIHTGDLVEIDSESFLPIQKVHAFLLNDSLMFATWLPHRRGPVKYKFQALYELDSLAVVNARDVGNCKNGFKILMFPDARTFNAENAKEKRMWLDILDETKRKKAALDSQRKEAAQQAALDRKSSSLDPSNPFAEPEAAVGGVDGVSEHDCLHVEWVQELPEDLDVCIAQRDFEGAVDLVEKINEYLEGVPKMSAVKEYRVRIEHRVKQLTEVLMHELQVSPERSIRGGPRAARRAVTQLIRLGKSAQVVTQAVQLGNSAQVGKESNLIYCFVGRAYKDIIIVMACNLFLKNRSAIIKYNLRQLKIEGNTSMYVSGLCDVFFANVRSTGEEFILAFPNHFGCFSSFVIWSKEELEAFVKVFSTQVFGNKSNFSTVAECVHEAATCCDKLSEIGLELRFVLDRLLHYDVQKVIQEAGDCQIEAVKHRAAEDGWQSVVFESGEALEKFEESFMEAGIQDVHSFSYNDRSTHLTGNTLTFTKSFSQFCKHLLQLYTEPLQVVISSAFTEIFQAQVAWCEKSWVNEKYKSQKKQIYENCRFLVESLLPIIRDQYNDKTGTPLRTTDTIQETWRRIKKAADRKS